MNRLLVCAAAMAVLVCKLPGQAPCKGTTLAGTVRDSTLALIQGATLTLDGDATAKSGQDGRFRFPCVPAGTHTVAAAQTGFGMRELSLKMPHAAPVDLVLQLEAVETLVEVEGDEVVASSSTGN